jgi:multidrug efflux pump subunit AcrA (membrane-fusion protein)
MSKVFHKAELTKVPLASGVGGEAGKFEVRVEFDIPPKNVKMGLTVSFQIVVEGKEGVVIVPVEFVRRARGRKYVMVREGKVDEERDVKLGISDDHHYHVIDGLKEGEQVILKVQSGDR